MTTTSSRPTYSELLRDPRWQRMRLEVMERAGFRCRDCGDATTTLNVHHGYYVKGRDPWDYPTESLLCLCEPCHETRHTITDQFKRDVGAFPIADLWRLLGYARGIWFMRQPPSDLPVDLGIGAPDGVADALGLTLADLEQLIGPDRHTTTNDFYAFRRQIRRGR